ncbi:MAG: DUF885 domain-containing protein [Deltaproteobacteria bacterium]|nr:DUF885 domain-containing protein [Deltaproteobacteria bacterium]
MTPYDAFAKAFHRHRTRDPNARIRLGVSERLGELPDPSLAEARSCVDEARSLLTQLDALPRDTLDFDDNLDIDLARLTLEAEIHRQSYTWNGRTRLQQTPSAGDEIGEGIFQLLINDPRPAEERLADILQRLEGLPDYLDALVERLDTPVARWAVMDLTKVAELPGLFTNVCDWAEEERWSAGAQLAAACDHAGSALHDYSERLRAIPTTEALHLDDETARRLVALRGIDLSFEQLHRIARDFLARNAEELEALRARLAPKYGLAPEASVEALEAELERRHVLDAPDGDFDCILARYEEERERIVEFVRQRDLFPIPDDQSLRILRTPAFMTPSIPAGAMMSPPPFRSGTRTSLVYLTLSRELLSEHTELGIPVMMIHEGIPGHHLQLAAAASHSSIIRRHMEAMDQAEGWTTMLEDYMLDVGYANELAEEVRFTGLRDIARIGARVAIDLFFMTGERDYLEVGVECDLGPADPFEAAGSLLGAVTGFVPGRVQAELNWYSQERGYPLSYLAGNHLVWELKADVEAAQRGRVEGQELDRAFHRAFLEAGSMPVRFLRRVFARKGLLDEAARPSS